MLHPQTPVPNTLMPNEKPLSGPIPINNMGPMAQQIPIQRPEFQPPPPINQGIMQNQAPVFSGQDVDLRSLDPRTVDPRLVRNHGDQDMRTLPALPNPLPPIGEK